MAVKRPLGIVVFASLLTVVGGSGLFVLLVQMIDSLRIIGIESVLITTPWSFLGFLIYGALPTLYYAAGVGLFTSKVWPRKVILYVLPVLTLMYFMNLAHKTAQSEILIVGGTMNDVMQVNLYIFARYFIRAAFVIVPLFIYFNLKPVVLYFTYLETKQS